MWALRQLGAADAITAVGSRIDAYRFVDRHGRALKTVDLRRLSGPWGEFSWAVPRARILDELASLIAPASIERNAEVLRLSRRDARWVLHVNGSEAGESHVLIGADGAHSRVRTAVWPTLPPARYQGFYALRGIAPLTLPEEWQHSVFQVWGAPGEFGFSPLGPHRVYWFGTIGWPESQPPPQLDDFLRHFSGWFDPIDALMTATPGSELLIHAIYDRLEPYPGFPDTVALIGDAAHLMTPNTGQGACQGIMDAWVMAALLARLTPQDALARYRSLRLSAALGVGRRSRTLGRIIHAAVLPEAIKREVLRKVPTAWVYGSMRHVVGAPPDLDHR
jgi:2-polyprenyl-6-methoxyphenol hydroxylase-like FAD-dependent oxidoreductase